jgi:hypothetical protein
MVKIDITDKERELLDRGLVALSQAYYIANWSIPEEQRHYLKELDRQIAPIRLRMYDAFNKSQTKITSHVKKKAKKK